MNLQGYISTGILEAYVLGDVTANERVEVEGQLTLYPELRAELKKIEETLEVVAMRAAIAPGIHVKEKLMRTTGSVKSEAKVVPIASAPVTTWKYAAAASVAIALMASYMAYSYRSRWIESQTALTELTAQNQQIAKDYNVVNQKLDKIQGDLSIIESTAFKKVVMKGTANNLNSLASVYWNESTQEVYLSIQNLKEISKEKQFQLWADVNGKMVGVGVFDKNFTGLLKMKNIAGAAAFAVTIEPMGGKENPTLETLQVIGALERIKS